MMAWVGQWRRFFFFFCCCRRASFAPGIASDFTTMAVTFSQAHGINVFVRSTHGKVGYLWSETMKHLYHMHSHIFVVASKPSLAWQSQCLWVDPYHDSVADTKKRLKDNSVWTWNGKPLQDDGVLADYGTISDGLTIHTYPRQRGGCFMVSLSILGIIMCAIAGSMCTCGLSLVVVPFLMPLLFILPLFCL